jgi:phenylalanyl-tRNA synthetase beta chain
MKFTLSWLKEHLETDAPLDAILQAMTMAGLEVEHAENPAETLKAFSVARIVSAEKHPNADKLRVCQVETKDGMKEIVCGAPNARAGLVTAYAPLGTYIPGSGITLEAKPVRGVVSNGMLCSGAELQLDTDADGILELDPAFPVGTPVAEVFGLDDPVVDFEVTPNRPDWLGVHGIARDLAAAGVGKFRAGKVNALGGDYDSPIVVEADAAAGCPIFAGRYFRNVSNGPSPQWLQRRLKAIGIKPRSALVDITNYVSYDRARPLHVYDAAKLKGAVIARLAKAGERFLALDGNSYDLSPDMCVIADERGVLGLGGVMGGMESGCSELTTDVLLESAWFEPNRIFKTGRATGIVSDAQYRFARGVDPGAVVDGLELASRMILDICGGEPSRPMVSGAVPAPPEAFAFDPDRVRTLSGLETPSARVKEILEALGFGVKAKGAAFTVTPPSFRRDVSTPTDLVEEVARIEGYDKLPHREPPRAQGFRAPAPSVGESRTRIARRALAAAGYLEAVTWSFCSRAQAQLFGGGADELVLANPIAAELDCMRPSALPNLLRAAQRNADRGRFDQRLFEAGPVYDKAGEGGQRRTIAAVMQPKPQRHWRGAAAADVFDLKRDALMLLEAIGAPVGSLSVGPPTAVWQHPGRGGAFKLGAKVIGVFGEVHPRVLKALDVAGPALALEIDLEALPAPRAKAGKAKPSLPKLDLMPLTRDFAFLVADEKPAADLVRAAFGADKELIADVALFDVYRGAGVPEGQKSLAIEVTIQPKDKTLTDAEIEALSAKVISAAAKSVGGVLRA